jgi:hypothetical protein
MLKKESVSRLLVEQKLFWQFSTTIEVGCLETLTTEVKGKGIVDLAGSVTTLLLNMCEKVHPFTGTEALYGP